MGKEIMADDSLMDILHGELVVYAMESCCVDKGDDAADTSAAYMTKLEHMGYSVGFRLAERLTRDWARFASELEMVKFVCKDFWCTLYGKQVDNLRTNHHGVYVLQDNRFRFLSAVSASSQYVDVAPRYLGFTCGVVRGALANLGVACVVTAECTVLPNVRFQIDIHRGGGAHHLLQPPNTPDQH